MKLLCRIFGCEIHRRHDGCCEECGAHIYDDDFIQQPCWLIRTWRIWWQWLRCKLVGHKCCHCGKRYWVPGPGGGELFCSLECDREHVPF